MSKPLSGIRVLDFTHMLSGPLGTYQLHLLGAEVLKVEPVGQGDAMRHGPGADGERTAPGFVGVNAGKQSIALDLKDPRGCAIALQLAAEADVVVENFRPGVIARFGLGYEDVLRVNPQVVYCSITGYGQHGPMRDWPAYDHVIQAVTGMATLSGDGELPVRVGFPLVDAASGTAAATAILAALLRRQAGAGAQYIDVSMVETASNLMASMLAGYLGTGQVPRATGNAGFTGSPGAGTFPTRDGWIAVGANTAAQFGKLCAVIAIAPLLDDPALIDASSRHAGFVKARDAAAVRARLEAGLAARDARHWEVALNAAGVPAARVRNIGEFADEVLQGTPGATVRLPAMPGYPQGITGLNVGHRTRHDPAGTSAPCPRLGEHTADAIARLGLSTEQIRALRDDGVIGCAAGTLPAATPALAAALAH